MVAVKSPQRRTILIVTATVLLAAGMVLWRTAALPVTDFTSFWIAGHRLLEHGNPYDVAHAQQVERSMGFTQIRPFVMRNPPWALWITLPLGLFGYSSAWFLWTICLVAFVAVATNLLWTVYGGSNERRWIAAVLGFVFAPTLACISVGQTAPVVLLGLALFISLQSTHEFWAGFALLAAAFKPHLVFLFWIALVLWSVQHRRWKLVAGAISSIALATAIALLFDRNAVREYRMMWLEQSLRTQFIPTLGGILRQVFGSPWLQILPAIIGCAAAPAYYYLKRRDWCWKRQLPLLLLASMLLTPYAWLVDEVTVLLALIAAAATLAANRFTDMLTVVFLLLNASIILSLSLGFLVVSPYYFWTTWVWILFYVAAKNNAAVMKVPSRVQVPDFAK